MYDRLLTFLWYSLLLTRVFADSVKFQDISRTWKMNLLFSRMRGNPGYLNKTLVTQI